MYSYYIFPFVNYVNKVIITMEQLHAFYKKLGSAPSAKSFVISFLFSRPKLTLLLNKKSNSSG